MSIENNVCSERTPAECYIYQWVATCVILYNSVSKSRSSFSTYLDDEIYLIFALNMCLNMGRRL